MNSYSDSYGVSILQLNMEKLTLMAAMFVGHVFCSEGTISGKAVKLHLHLYLHITTYHIGCEAVCYLGIVFTV